jgi:hypothetical protein
VILPIFRGIAHKNKSLNAPLTCRQSNQDVNWYNYALSAHRSPRISYDDPFAPARYLSKRKDFERLAAEGEQKMTVQHVHVAEGGQAIVGNANAPAEGGGARGKTGDQPHALGYAPGIPLPREIEAERVAVPSAGCAGS